MCSSRSIRSSCGRRSRCSSTCSRRSKEIERKARQEQALLDANLRANAERLRAEQELRRAEQRQAAIIQSLPMVLYLEPYDAEQRRPNYVSGDFEAITGFHVRGYRQASPNIWADRLHADDRDRVIAALEAGAKDGPLVDRISLAMRRRQLQAFPRPGRAAEGCRRRARSNSPAR